MSENVFYYCSTSEVSTLASNILLALASNDWSKDLALTAIIEKLKSNNDLLLQSLRVSNSGELLQQLHDLDEKADRTFVCVKQFLKANIYDLDEKKANDATLLWQVFSKHNLNLNHQNFETQMAMSKALIDNMTDDTLKTKMDGLTGVSRRFEDYVKASKAFRTKFNEVRASEAMVEDLPAPSIQKKMVRDIINKQLLTYLNGVVMALPDVYGDIVKVIDEHISNCNAKAKARKTLNKKEEPITK